MAGLGCRVIILGKSGFIVCACEVVRECLCACVCVVCVWCVCGVCECLCACDVRLGVCLPVRSKHDSVRV